jgi:hypothetical protein
MERGKEEGRDDIVEVIKSFSEVTIRCVGC